jgi:hypothetical protein
MLTKQERVKLKGKEKYPFMAYDVGKVCADRWNLP